jgi:GrpB-like predicted nucleotidyltransferase (UPF0157 family)
MELRAVMIGPLSPLTERIELADYDQRWPLMFEEEARRVRSILGDRVLRLEHVGSTAVPGLPAKPVIDLVMTVVDSADEASYVPPMEAAGYILRIREPAWHEHRLFKGPAININLHVFSARCSEVDRMLFFRDWLRVSEADRLLYAETKRQLAGCDWRYVQSYADAKTAVVQEIIRRAESALD